jgi:hypothetical protein
MHDDGTIQARTRLVRPMARETVSFDQFEHSHWREAAAGVFAPVVGSRMRQGAGIL